MRKLLLASAAIIGASAAMTGLASAQTAAPGAATSGTVITPASGGMTTFGDNNYMLGTMAHGPVANPTPGTMVIRLSGRVFLDGTMTFSNLNHIGSSKLAPYGLAEYMRLYPGVDAMAANGLRYGAAIELRQNFGASPASTTGAAGGSAYTSTQTVFVRRAMGYVAGDQWGILRVGEMDGLIGTYDNGGVTTGVSLSPTGTIVGGDLQGSFVSNAWMTPWFAAQSGNEYGNAKIVYLTPSFAGFDAGLQYAPTGFGNQNAIGAPGACASAAGDTGCPNLASSPTPGSGSRIKDQLAVGVHYANTLNGLGVQAYGVYMTSGHVNYTGSPTALALGSVRSGAAGGYNGKYDPLSLGSIGAAVTMAGFTVFGNTMIGDYNGTLAMKPEHGVNAKGWVAGAKYAFGPATIGALYSSFDSQGDQRLVGVSQRHENIFYAAATYRLAPGLITFVDYAYGTRHQGGFNFATNSVTVDPGAFNNVRSQGALLGMMVTW